MSPVRGMQNQDQHYKLIPNLPDNQQDRHSFLFCLVQENAYAKPDGQECLSYKCAPPIMTTGGALHRPAGARGVRHLARSGRSCFAQMGRTNPLLQLRVGKLAGFPKPVGPVEDRLSDFSKSKTSALSGEVLPTARGWTWEARFHCRHLR